MSLAPEVRLRRAERGDVALLLEWMEQTGFERAAPFAGRMKELSREARVGAVLGGPAAAEITGSFFFVAELAGAGPVGLASIQEIAWRNRNCVLGVFTDERISLADEARRRLFEASLRYCFDEMDMRRVTLWDEAGGVLKELAGELGAEREVFLPGYGAGIGGQVDIVGYGVLQEAFYASCPGMAAEKTQ